jgi:hypothetical protein
MSGRITRMSGRMSISGIGEGSETEGVVKGQFCRKGVLSESEPAIDLWLRQVQL